MTIRSLRGSDFIFDQTEALVVLPGIVFFTAGPASHCAAHRADARDHREAGRACVGMFPFHLPAFEGKRMVCSFTGDSQLGASGFPFDPVWIDLFPAAALVGEQVGELVFQSAPCLFFGEIFQLRV